MSYKVEHVKDTLGNNYLAININGLEVEPYLDKLKEILGEDNYTIYTTNQQNRDHGKYHITVINVMDYNRLTKQMGIDKFVEALQPVLEYEIDDLQIPGIGKAEAKGNTAYFAVCKSDKLDAIRTRFELGKQDFHITIGFDKKDVFGVPKNEIIAEI
jgi:hypothetical protein